jgi:adenylate cyclase
MRPTLRQVFGFSLLGLLLGLGLLFYLVRDGSEQTLLKSADRYRRLASSIVAQRVTSYLDQAPMAVAHFEQQVKYGLIDPRNTDSLQRGLLSLLLANDNLSEATLTYANSKGDGRAGTIVIDRASAGQVALLRSTAAGEFIRRLTWFNGAQFVSQSVTLSGEPASGAASSGSPVVPAMDPTAHDTFQGAINPDDYGQIISTDLHWSQLDATLPEARRRVEVSVQKTIEDNSGHFVGVLRVGLLKAQIDRAVQLHIADPAEVDQHLIFLCDKQGRLISLGQRGTVAVSGDDLRVIANDAPAMVAKALQQSALKDIDPDHPLVASFRIGNDIYLCTFSSLPGTQDWIVGIVVPRNFYLGPLVRISEQLFWASLALIIGIVVAGVLIIRSVVRSHSLILKETTRMKEFEFSPARHSSYLRDIADVLVGLERAKTAMRAMSKYVPVNLVRQLYNKGEEPVLGGKSSELSVLFTDIKDFTAFAESITPDELAEVLGRYLQVMAKTIQDERGTIDKYIGDAVMTFWNAPETVPNHAILACRAALRCQEALQKLYDSPDWGRAPRFETRFGLHRCAATVGHFGAPDRLNYTAIGDGINLASRLEGLNKQYGTHIIASETIHAAAQAVFEFRLLDRVAVKGKTESIVIYELLSERIEGRPRPAAAERYEQAFALYQRGEFADALPLLDHPEADAPSRVLAQRCREFLLHPPANWNGIHVFDMK